ncbi:MAG: hypothetical protein GX217_01100 [Clostridiaceae bacterium]|nr:hypothetical protein [Clostridiaceae bacterium]
MFIIAIILLICIVLVVILVDKLKGKIGMSFAQSSREKINHAARQQTEKDPALPTGAACLIVDNSMRVIAFERDKVNTPRPSNIVRISDSQILQELHMLQQAEACANKLPNQVFYTSLGEFTVHLQSVIDNIPGRLVKVPINFVTKHLYFLLAEEDDTFLLLSPAGQQKIFPVIET